MITASDLVDQLQAKLGGVSVYKVAAHLGLKNGRVHTWHQNTAAPNVREAIRLADALDLDRGYVLACMEAQRQSEPEIAEAFALLAASRFKETSAFVA